MVWGHMPLRELGVRRSYDTGVAGADVLNGFYIPALSESCTYDRLSGSSHRAPLPWLQEESQGLSETVDGCDLRLAPGCSRLTSRH